MNFSRRNWVVCLLASAALSVLAFTQSTDPAPSPADTGRARLAAAEKVCEMLHDMETKSPRAHQGVEHTYLWSVRRMEAQRALEMAKDRGLAAMEGHAKRMREYAAWVARVHDTEQAFSVLEVSCTQFYAAEAEDLLARAKAK